MDIFDFRATHSINVEGIFSVDNVSSDDLGGMFIRLMNLVTSALHTKWDIAFFENYISESMVPRSLRWEVAPQSDISDLAEWFQYFNKAGLGLLGYMLSKKKKKNKNH